MTDSRRLAFVGLGVMGYPMASHLAAAGHQVVVYNRTETRAALWCAEHDGSIATTPGSYTPLPLPTIYSV